MNTNKSLITALLVGLLILFGNSMVLAGDTTLNWDAPTTNTDESNLTDLTGYMIYYGTVSSVYTQSIDVGNVTIYLVDNLTEGETYYFAISAYNALGYESGYSNEISRTISGVDTIAPVISGTYESNITTVSAVIHWTTNEASDTQIEYGTTLSYGSLTIINSTMLTVHSQTISNLNPSTKYFYRTISADASGNIATSDSYTVTTLDAADTTAPLISNILVTGITDSSVTITWTTDEASDSQVKYGTDIYYGNLTAIDSNLAANHSVNISGLSGSTRHEFRVISIDFAGNKKVSINNSFDTSNTSPAINSFSADIYSGYSPLTVNFEVSASDADGYITKYEWDFNGDGSYEESTAAPYYIYMGENSYNARVRVTDSGGATTLSNIITINMNTAATPAATPNRSPVLRTFSVSHTYDSNTDEITATFSVSSSDSDGSIVLYEWDFDGNNTYDIATTSTPVSYVYSNVTNSISAAGSMVTYNAKLKITDNQGATTTGTTAVTVDLNSTSENSTQINTSSDSGDNEGGGGGCFISLIDF